MLNLVIASILNLKYIYWFQELELYLYLNMGRLQSIEVLLVYGGGGLWVGGLKTKVNIVVTKNLLFFVF